MTKALKIPEKKQRYTDLCSMAIPDFNSQNGKKYEFVDVVTVNGSFAAGVWYYFTFQARDTTDGVKTFQALVWDGISGEKYAKFCGLKKYQGAGDEVIFPRFLWCSSLASGTMIVIVLFFWCIIIQTKEGES